MSQKVITKTCLRINNLRINAFYIPPWERIKLIITRRGEIAYTFANSATFSHNYQESRPILYFGLRNKSGL